MTSMLKRISVWIATGFGLGYSPIASGTVGCLLGIPLVMLTWPGSTWGAQLVFALALSVLAIPFCDVAEGEFKKKDDGRIVADEYMTFPLCMIGLPLDPLVVAVCFVSNRFFDIVKFPPANQFQRLKGGTGIVIDDVFAALYSLAANHLVYALVLKKFLG